jgi:hypothetical protein
MAADEMRADPLSPVGFEHTIQAHLDETALAANPTIRRIQS